MEALLNVRVKIFQKENATISRKVINDFIKDWLNMLLSSTEQFDVLVKSDTQE